MDPSLSLIDVDVAAATNVSKKRRRRRWRKQKTASIPPISIPPPIQKAKKLRYIYNSEGYLVAIEDVLNENAVKVNHWEPKARHFYFPDTDPLPASPQPSPAISIPPSLAQRFPPSLKAKKLLFIYDNDDKLVAVEDVLNESAVKLNHWEPKARHFYFPDSD